MDYIDYKKKVTKVFPNFANAEIKGYKTGYYLSEPKVVRLNKCYHGVSYSAYGEMLNPICGMTDTPIIYLHRWCLKYLVEFVKNNPGWKSCILIRDTGYQSLIHCFAYKKKNNSYLFADARGITDNIFLFMEDFHFSDKAIQVWLGKRANGFLKRCSSDNNDNTKILYDFLQK